MRRTLRWAVFPLTALVILAFPYGPLFPWSPVKPGYQRMAAQRGEVWYPNGFPSLDAYRGLDSDIEGVERFLGLPVTRAVTVIDARDWSDFHRFVPQVMGARVGAVTMLTGTKIVVSPRIRERGLDIREFIRHELTHAAMHQNQNPWQAIQGPRLVPWLCEGLPVSYGRQKAYLTRAEFLDRVRAGADLRAAIDRTTSAPGRDIRFDYLAWRYFNEYLRHRRGGPAFRDFLRAFLADHTVAREGFPAAFGESLEGAIASYGRDLRSGAWLPPEDPSSRAATATER